MSHSRFVLSVMAIVNAVMGLQWVVLSSSHSSLFPYAWLVHIGALVVPGAPMVLWGILFVTVAVVQLVGILRGSPRTAGVGFLLAAPLLVFYSVLYGAAIIGNPLGVATVSILGAGFGVISGVFAAGLLGRRFPEWR